MIDRNRIDREVLLAHVSGMNRVLFSYSWLYDGGLHYYPSVRFSSNIIEDNFKLKLTMRNITDHRTGKWDCKCFNFNHHGVRFSVCCVWNLRTLFPIPPWSRLGENPSSQHSSPKWCCSHCRQCPGYCFNDNRSSKFLFRRFNNAAN